MYIVPKPSNCSNVAKMSGKTPFSLCRQSTYKKMRRVSRNTPGEAGKRHKAASSGREVCFTWNNFSGASLFFLAFRQFSAKKREKEAQKYAKEGKISKKRAKTGAKSQNVCKWRVAKRKSASQSPKLRACGRQLTENASGTPSNKCFLWVLRGANA